MLWLIFRSVLCINYKIEHWWVYSYTETMDLEFITQRFSKEEIDCVELKLENPFEKKRLESVIKSSLVKIKKTRDKIEFKFFFDAYKNFEFLKNDHKNSIFFTEFNFNPPKIIENKLRVKYMLEKRAEKKRERIARGESDSDSDSSSEDEIKEVDCRPKIISGFIFSDRKKNERLEYRRTDYYHYQRFAPFEGSRYLETLFLQRIVNLINYIKAFPDNRIQIAVDKMRKSIASGESDEDEKGLHTRLVDLLSVISKNRRLPNLGHYL
ncbi:hypothetical protein NBO_549g0001 [Nosema bombycis CQ1]|uniref:Uncharacterized protein n=1 Tax=Nosema bombycis (strain CQ1 / CVCC 102059) TaxID=578461 RepID=R0KN65_NOSB1|nr:hypothetical protein NBO_549g0001 [Nosema bombycis CQ1]|eukprot:EOB12101.1 hypothetical protein NBO_549g0001 [Nosema bombycis CQ1]